MQYSIHETDIHNALRILFLENIPGDVEKTHAMFQEEGIPCSISQVETRDEFVSAIQQINFDLILANIQSPLFDGMAALHVAKLTCPDVPFIMIANSPGEDVAINALKNGAADCIYKQTMPKLALSTKQVIKETTFKKRRNEDLHPHHLSENRYRTLFDKMPNGFAYHQIVFDHKTSVKECIIVDVNQAFERLFNKTRNELLGKKTTEIFSGDPHNSEIIERLAKSVLQGNEVRLEHYMLQNDKWFSISAYSPEPGYLATILEDITKHKNAEKQRQKLEEELRHAQKMETIGQLAGGIAHDFNNLLMPIIVYSEMILKGLSLKDPRHKQVKYIWESANKAKNLAKQLLAFGRKQVMEMKTQDVNLVLSNFQSMLRRTIREDVDIQFFAHTAPCIFRGDISQIEQILINLAVNAQDAMPDGGTITIKTEIAEISEKDSPKFPDLQTGCYLVIEFIDTGTGMDAATASQVFDPFFTTKQPGKGTGLGLSTAFGIAKQHGGSIIVNSRLGRGTCFRVYLPSEENEVATKEDPTTFHPTIETGNETLLLVEDDQIARETISHILTLGGYKVLIAENGPKALKLSKKHKGNINLLVTDVIMPQMNGYDLYTKISKSRKTMKVLFVSGYTTEAAENRGISKDEINYLPKPFTVKSLTDKVRNVLDE